MSTTNMHVSGSEKDKQLLISIVKDMGESMSGARSTKHWTAEVLWFDIPPFVSRGIPPAVKMFDHVFSNFQSYKTSFLHLDVTLNETLGVVCSTQQVDIAFRSGVNKTVMVRQTDCFRKTNNAWQLFHQHASLGSGGEWDGKIVTEI